MGDVAAGFIGLTDVFSRRVADVGIDVVRTAIDASTQAYTDAFDKLVSVLVEDVDPVKFQERYKLPATGTLQPVDEWGRPKPVQGEVYYTQAYPLQMGAHAWGTNWVALEKLTVQEANDNTLAAMRADADWNIRRILAALFYNASWTFGDKEKGDLTIYPLAVGESTVKYVTRTGALVTSTNYRAQANAIDASNNPFPATVRLLRMYPVNQGPIVTYIHNDQRASIEGLAGFVPVSDPDVVDSTASDRLANNGPAGHLGDELIGKVNGSWVAEWERVPTGYMVSHALGTKVIGRRQDPEASLQGFIKREIREGSLTTYEFYRRAGYAPRNRVGVVVNRIGNASYAPPSEYATMPLVV